MSTTMEIGALHCSQFMHITNLRNTNSKDTDQKNAKMSIFDPQMVKMIPVIPTANTLTKNGQKLSENKFPPLFANC